MRGPVFYALARLATRRALRREGYTFWQVNTMMDGAEDDVIDAAIEGAHVALPVALGDGSVIRAILDFLESEQGQRLIQTILSILTALL